MAKKINNKSILVIDDDSHMLGALDKVLTNAGAAVTCEVWAGEVLKNLGRRQKQFDLVITDLHMPFISGLTALNAIHTFFPGLPVIVLTAFGGPDIERECFRRGAKAFLEKPLDTPHLLEAIAKVLDSERECANTPATLMENL